MDIKIFTAWKDNYMYLIIDKKTNDCACVDPVEPEKINSFIQKESLNLVYILTTHHHADHASGNETLLKMIDKVVPVVGGDDRINSLSKKVMHEDMLTLGNLKIRCLLTPCHTTGHICYYVECEETDPAVFTGDTLFSAGCGRFFEGTGEEMYRALITILGNLSPYTRVYCGHEYTVKNLKFALTIEPDNENVKRKLEWAISERDANRPTLPSTIFEEKRINPFMRVTESSVMEVLNKPDPVSAITSLRILKDNF